MDWIQGDKFKELATLTYSPTNKLRDDYDRLPNTFTISAVNDGCIIYTHTIYVKELLEIIKEINKMEILVCLGLGVGVIGVKCLILYFLN